jgi:hypothetical protein
MANRFQLLNLEDDEEIAEAATDAVAQQQHSMDIGV